MNDGIDIDPTAVRDAAGDLASAGLFAGKSGADGMQPSSSSGRAESLEGLQLSGVLDSLDSSWADKCSAFSTKVANYAWNLRGYATSIEDEDYVHGEAIGDMEMESGASRSEADWYGDLPGYSDVNG